MDTTLSQLWQISYGKPQLLAGGHGCISVSREELIVHRRIPKIIVKAPLARNSLASRFRLLHRMIGPRALRG